MRRGVTVLVVVVVAAIGLAAAFDALRGGSEPAAQTEPAEPPSTSTAESPDEPAESPEQPQFGGVLYFTDETCALQGLDLATEQPAEAPNWDECRFVLSPDGRRASGAGSGWDPHSDPQRGRLFESDGQTIQVSTNAGPEAPAFQGAAPAWRPDGTLTYFADGAVREWPSGEVVLSQRFFRRALERSPDPTLRGRFDRFELREALWLSDTRLAAIVTAEGDDEVADLLAVYDAQLLEGWLDRPGGLSDLRASPNGRYVAARESGQRGFGELLLVEPGEGAFQGLPIEGYRAIAWSPDEEWAAVATDTGVSLFQPGVPGPPSLALALGANDLDWRGGPEPVEATAQPGSREASAWLATLGVGGRLFVTQPEGGGCRLRSLEIPELGWADTPPGEDIPCRFTISNGTLLPDDRGACEQLENCAFAEMPDGSPTFVTGGEIFAGRPGGRAELLVSAADLERIVGRPGAFEEVAWVDDERFWAIVRTGETATVALMTAEGLVASPWFGAPSVSGLRLSLSGMAAVSSDRGVVFFDRAGRRVLTFTNGRDVTWAPGEIVAAVSTPREVIFVAPLSGEVVTVSLEVRDLEWVVP